MDVHFSLPSGTQKITGVDLPAGKFASPRAEQIGEDIKAILSLSLSKKKRTRKKKKKLKDSNEK